MPNEGFKVNTDLVLSCAKNVQETKKNIENKNFIKKKAKWLGWLKVNVFLD